MKILELKYFLYSLKFKSNFTNSNESFNQKKIIIIQLKDEAGNSFYGECTTLPNFYDDNINEMMNRLNMIRPFFEKQNLNNINFPKIFNFIVNYPPLVFGLDQAIFNIQHFYKSIPANNYFEFSNKNEISINAIIDMNDKKNIIKQIESLFQNGFETFKLKFGRENFNNDLKLLTTIKNQFNDKIKIRVDVNGKWTFTEALKNLERLQIFNLEYIEQPVKNTEELIELSNKCEVNIAADESVRNINDAEELINNSRINVLVLKPSLMGKIEDVVNLISKAEEKGIDIVISSAFESSFGRSILPFFASVTQNNYAHGLATIDLFKNDFPISSYKINNGKITINQNDITKSINLQAKFDIANFKNELVEPK